MLVRMLPSPSQSPSPVFTGGGGTWAQLGQTDQVWTCSGGKRGGGGKKISHFGETCRRVLDNRKYPQELHNVKTQTLI